MTNWIIDWLIEWFTDGRNGYLLNESNASLEIHAEVNELPDDAFLLVLLLLEDEHVMVEELLQTLVGVVDAQLFERVVLQTTQQTFAADAV